MIKIIKASELQTDFFAPRDFVSVGESVKKIIADVKQNGDAALAKYAKQFDKVSLEKFLVDETDVKFATEKLQKENAKLYDALLYARDLIFRFAQKQKECFYDFETELESGVFTGQKIIPVERAGVYVPAGNFPLFSSVLMTVMPAKASGVSEIILCTPPRRHPDDEKKAYADENILAAAYLCGVEKIFAAGGAQAIGAMAFGTESIPPCDVIAGPGNKFVAEAKKEVYGKVGIDMLAGPTEVFIIADGNANAKWVASDLLAQAEHDVAAQAILATNDEGFAHAVQTELDAQLKTLATKAIAEKSINDFGKIIIAKTLDEACDIANKKAPEHLELALCECDERTRLEKKLHNFGSLFAGHGAAEVLGDYAAGLNHTLPTSTSARFTGGLSVRAFLKTVTTLRVDVSKKGFQRSANAARILGEAEGLVGHANAARFRIE